MECLVISLDEVPGIVRMPDGAVRGAPVRAPGHPVPALSRLRRDVDGHPALARHSGSPSSPPVDRRL
jgi:hypothetical protein